MIRAAFQDRGRRHPAGFTLIEVLVSTAVLLLIILSVTLLFSAAQTAIGLNNKRSDADIQARSVFDRMAVDFAQMVRRPDVDYYLKDATNAPQTGGAGGQSDQLAFYSQVPGYYLSANGGAGVATNLQSPVSLVAYRINSDGGTPSPAYAKLERLGRGLLWNGASANAGSSVIFSPLSDSWSPTNTIGSNWPEARSTSVSTSTNDPTSYYEVAGSQVFRFEYFYLLRGMALSNGTVLPPAPSLTPWNTDAHIAAAGMTAHTSVNGMADVSAIVVTMALADQRSRAFSTDDQWYQFGATLQDVANDATGGIAGGMYPGSLALAWQGIVDSNAATTLGRPAAAGIRIYQRYFYLPQNPTP